MKKEKTRNIKLISIFMIILFVVTISIFPNLNAL